VTRNLRALAAAILVLASQSWILAAPAPVIPSNDLVLPETIPSKEEFLEWPDRVRNWLAEPQSVGLTASASTVIPSAVHLIITARAGPPMICSGVVVASMHVLTAAHCVCGVKANDPWFYETAAKCLPTLRSLSVDVVIPSEGIIKVGVPPRIPDAYRSPEMSPLNANVRIADLALVTLPRPVRTPPASIGVATGSESYAFAAFGRLTFSTGAEPFEAKQVYEAGIGQVSVQSAVAVVPSYCGEQGAADAICAQYNGTPVGDGPFRDAGGCEGDSGGPLYLRNQGGVGALIGILSYRSPQGGSACDARVSHIMHFVNVSQYLPWIQSHIEGDARISTFATCGEKIIQGPAKFRLESLPAQIIVTPISIVAGPQSERRLSIDGVPREYCARSERLGTDACFASLRDQPSIALSQGYALVTICWH
jgi:Trypsin